MVDCCGGISQRDLRLARTPSLQSMGFFPSVNWVLQLVFCFPLGLYAFRKNPDVPGMGIATRLQRESHMRLNLKWAFKFALNQLKTT